MSSEGGSYCGIDEYRVVREDGTDIGGEVEWKKRYVCVDNTVMVPVNEMKGERGAEGQLKNWVGRR